MKRTKQVFHYAGDDVPQYVSGCRQFDGEDLRKLFQKLLLLLIELHLFTLYRL